MGRLDGIVVRHRSKCRKLNGGERCTCRPSYRAWVWSPEYATKIWRSFPTQAAARAWRQEAGGQVRRGTLRPATSTTVREAAEELIDGIRSGRVRTKSGDAYKPSALRGYEQALRLRVLPQLGGARLADVRRKDVQQLADEMLAEGASPSGIRNAIMPLRVIFRRALEDGEVAIDPCARLRLPAVRSQRDRVASPQEAAALLAALPPRIRTIYACAFYGGLRAGELRALRWDDVDLAGGIIRVERAMDGSGVIVEPKSRYGRRRVPVVGVLRDLLVEHKAATWSEGFVLGPAPHRAFTPSNVHRRAKAAWEKSDESLKSIGLHEARHTFASLLIAAGVNAKAISVFMGHASVETTFDLYGHLMPGGEAEAAALLDDYLERADTRHRLTAIGQAEQRTEA
jgi:integrase